MNYYDFLKDMIIENTVSAVFSKKCDTMEASYRDIEKFLEIAIDDVLLSYRDEAIEFLFSEDKTLTKSLSLCEGISIEDLNSMILAELLLNKKIEEDKDNIILKIKNKLELIGFLVN